MTATYKRRCDGQPDRVCPNKPMCGLDCQFNCDDTPHQRAMHAAVVKHTATDYSLPVTMDDEPSEWRWPTLAVVLVAGAAALVMIFGTK